MYIWSIFEGYLAGFYTYPVAIPIRAVKDIIAVFILLRTGENYSECLL